MSDRSACNEYTKPKWPSMYLVCLLQILVFIPMDFYILDKIGKEASSKGETAAFPQYWQGQVLPRKDNIETNNKDLSKGLLGEKNCPRKGRVHIFYSSAVFSFSLNTCKTT